MFVLGTAGHVDHGKSTLVERLTGIDPDRFAEEKRRGLTIDLGFAWTTLPSGREVGIVDVPGHERFIRNMLAGAGQVDAVIFVVDANEGWRRQSEEHLAILDLLGVERGVVALTKADIARDIPAVTSQIAAELRTTPLQHAPIIPVSAITGDGIPALITALDRLLDGAPEPGGDRPRLYVDRSFTVAGAGTVVTGTLTGGSIRIEDQLVILPKNKPVRVRSIQTHKLGRDVAVPTSRVALNLAGIATDDVVRGDALVRSGQWEPTKLIDIELQPVRRLDHSISERGAFLIYAGTSETGARIKMIGERFARLTLSEPLVLIPGDRVVIRDTGRQITVGGGRVLDAHPSSARITDRTEGLLQERAGAGPSSLGDVIVKQRGVVETRRLPALAGVESAPNASVLPGFLVAPAWLAWMQAKAEQVLRRFHQEHPFEQGMTREALRSALTMHNERLFTETVAAFDSITAEGPLVKMNDHAVPLGSELDDVRSAASGMQPPTYRELIARFEASRVHALIQSGDLIRVSEEIVVLAETMASAKTTIAKAFEDQGPLTAAQIKDALGTTRKYAIPLLEHLDREGFTQRDGDVRSIRL